MELDKSIQKLKNGEDLTIVAFGDSLTYGWMVNKGYVDFLNEMLLQKYPKSKFTLINKGLPGNTSMDGFHRMNDDVISLKPDLVLIQFGLNDAYLGYTAHEYENYTRLMIDKLRLYSKAEILLVTSLSIHNNVENEVVGKFYEKLILVAKDEKVSISCVHEYWKEKVSEGLDYRILVHKDGVHPTVEGYKIMAEAIMQSF